MADSAHKDETIVVICHSVFLVYDKESALKLRRNRIVGQLNGCFPNLPHQLVESGFPYLLNHYSAKMALEMKFVQFKQLVSDKQLLSSEQANTIRFQADLDKLQKEAEEKHKANRLAELASRNLEPTQNRMGRFDRNKLRLEVVSLPGDLSSFRLISVDRDEVEKFVTVDSEKFVVFRDLYHRGFYTTLGTKFGCDFLSYTEDPIRYHAQYAIRVIPSVTREVNHPLLNINYNEINALNRLTRAARKVLLLALVDQQSSVVNYLTLPDKQYLDSSFEMDMFKRIDPTPQ